MRADGSTIHPDEHAVRVWRYVGISEVRVPGYPVVTPQMIVELRIRGGELRGSGGLDDGDGDRLPRKGRSAAALEPVLGPMPAEGDDHPAGEAALSEEIQLGNEPGRKDP